MNVKTPMDMIKHVLDWQTSSYAKLVLWLLCVPRVVVFVILLQ
jgi:hypothetical protein